MGKVALCRGVTFGAPQFFYDASSPTLDPAIDRQSNSLAVYVNGFVTTAFFEQPNYGGSAIVITNPGSVKDLSVSPWGNWANRIRSVLIGAQVNHVVESWDKDDSRKGYQLTVVGDPLETFDEEALDRDARDGTP
jgi:hypothetical protein